MQGRGGGGVFGHGRRPEGQPLPPPPPRNCPRCDSMNTKFCYYNNYSLSQPRYCCRDCRRYWTHGGALRNIPYGGSSRKPRQPITLTTTTITNPTNHHQPPPISNNVSLPQPIHYGGVRFLPSSSSSPLQSVLGGGFQSPELDVPTMHGFNHPHQLHHPNLFPPPPAYVAAVPDLDHQPAVAAPAENPEAFWKDLLGGSSFN